MGNGFNGLLSKVGLRKVSITQATRPMTKGFNIFKISQRALVTSLITGIRNGQFCDDINGKNNLLRDVLYKCFLQECKYYTNLVIFRYFFLVLLRSKRDLTV